MTNPIYSPPHVANFFLNRAEVEGYSLTQLKLLKLVYIAYGWVLATLEQKLFDEEIEAWQHGPVVPSLYHEFKSFGRQPITGRAVVEYFDERSMDFSVTSPAIPSNDHNVILILSRVWDVYKNLTGWELRDRTHETGTPWAQATGRGEKARLNDDEIQAYYTRKLGEYLNA